MMQEMVDALKEKAKESWHSATDSQLAAIEQAAKEGGAKLKEFAVALILANQMKIPVRILVKPPWE